MPPKPSESPDEMVARIVAAARSHFMEHGFRSVTMDDLATELGMSKKTLYQHFRTKAGLLAAVLDAKFSEASAEMANVAEENAGDFIERLHGMLACVRRHTSEISPSFLRDLARSEPDLFALVQTRRSEMIRTHWRALLAEGQKQRMVRRDLSLEVMLAVLTGAADAVVTPKKLEALGMSAKDAVSEIITLFTEGVATEKGRLKI